MKAQWEVPIPEGESIFVIVKADPKEQAKFGPTILCKFQLEHDGDGTATMEMFMNPNLGRPEKLSLFGQLLVAGGRDPRTWDENHPFMRNVSLAVIDMVTEGTRFIGKVESVPDRNNPTGPPRKKITAFSPLPEEPEPELAPPVRRVPRPAPQATPKAAARPAEAQVKRPAPPPKVEVPAAVGDEDDYDPFEDTFEEPQE